MKAGVRTLWIVIGGALLLNAADLQSDTLDAWRGHIQNTTRQFEENLAARNAFLQADKNPDLDAKLQRGEVVVTPVGCTPEQVPGGLIHDWMVSAYLPGVRIDEVLAILRSYGEYKQYYKPAVIDSRDLGSGKAGDVFLMLLRNRSILSHTAVETQYQAFYKQLDEKRWYGITHTVRIQEIENFGKADEHRLDTGAGSGYLWRAYTLSRFEERDGGTYIQMEIIALSRGIPGPMRWLVDPMIKRIAKNTLTAFMNSTRGAVMARTGHAFPAEAATALLSGSADRHPRGH